MNKASLALRDDDPQTARIEAEARAWLLRTPSPETDAACAAWRAADPRHEQAFVEARRVWTALGRTAHARDSGWRSESLAEPLPSRMRRLARPMAIAASIGAIAAIVAPLLAPPGARVATATAQTRAVRLADGSRVFVGARSAVDLKVSPTSRQVTLKDGEAFFEVAHDPAHPFTVVAGDALITVRGTKFDVRRTRYGVQVAVLEGRVEVSRRPLLPLSRPTPPERVLGAGQQVRMERGEGLTPVAAAGGEPGAWRKGRLLYADAPLKEVVADANRYSDHPIRLASKDIGELRVTVGFRAAKVDELVADLDRALPIRSERDGDAIVLSADEATK